MKLNSAPVAGDYTKEVGSRFMKLLFVIKCGIVGTPFSATAALAAVRTATFELEKVNGTGTETIVRKGSLLNYLEIGSALSNGPVTVVTDGDISTVKGDIIIAVDGDIVPVGAEQYNVKVSGLPANVSADIYLLQTGKDAKHIFDYNRVSVVADVPGRIELTGAHLLCIPKGNITKLELEAHDKTRIEYLSAELEQHLNDLNAQAFNINGAVTPVGLDLFTFPVASAFNGFLTCSADVKPIVVNVKAI